MAGMITKEDVTAELQPKRIQRDGEHLRKIIEHICDTNNPFDVNNSLKHFITLALERVQVKKSNKASLQFQPKERPDMKHSSIRVS